MIKSILKSAVVVVLTILARVALSRYRPKVVAITGSVGKTSTKDAVATALSAFHTVRKSRKSFNSEIGVPLTILDLGNAWSSASGWTHNIVAGFKIAFGPKRDFPEWLVLEVGADHPGDIKKIARWLHPDVVVLTRFPDVPVHVEFFDSPEKVIEEKRYLRKALKHDGILVVNADDLLTAKEPTIATQRKITFGLSSEATVRAESSDIKYENGKPTGLQVRVSTGGGSIPLTLKGSIGRGHVGSVLAAIAVVQALNLNVVGAIRALAAHEPPSGRMRLIDGIKNSVIIDDTYNASPVAVAAGIEALGNVTTTGKRILALADMKELGVFSKNAHHTVGAEVAEAHQKGLVDYFIAVGESTGEAAEAAIANGMPSEMVMRRLDSVSAGQVLVGLIEEHDIVLVKGSQSMRMEKAVKMIMAHPEEAPDLLVRQEEEWQNR